MAPQSLNKQILVTGGAGFVGSNLCIALKEKYPAYEVFALDNLRRRGSELNLRRLQEHGVRFIHGDVRNAEDLAGFDHLDVIIDASADPSVLAGIESPVIPLVNSNLLGTVHCLELAQKHDAFFIFLSTSRVYPGAPLESAAFVEMDTRFQWTDEQSLAGISAAGISEEFTLNGSRTFYGATKLCSEMLITEYHALKGLRTVINRCGIIAGPWQMGKADQGVVALWVARHYFNRELSYIGYGGTGKQTRDVLHVADLFALVDQQMHNQEVFDGGVFNAGGGPDVSFSLQELTGLCQAVTGNKISITPVPQTRTADIRIYISDAKKLKRLAGWQPTHSLSDLVSDVFCWIKENETNLQGILC